MHISSETAGQIYRFNSNVPSEALEREESLHRVATPRLSTRSSFIVDGFSGPLVVNEYVVLIPPDDSSESSHPLAHEVDRVKSLWILFAGIGLITTFAVWKIVSCKDSPGNC